MTEVEAVLLTGGASRRMGSDKASLLVKGLPMAEGVANKLAECGYPVTVLGRDPIVGFGFLPDSEDFAGPLSALARYQPSSDLVFVASCDLPDFDPNVVAVLKTILGQMPSAAVPCLDGRLQPLCALYRRAAWGALAHTMAQGKRSLMAWLERLEVTQVTEVQLVQFGLDPTSLRGVNTPDDLRRLSG